MNNPTTCKANGCPLPYDHVTDWEPTEDKYKRIPKWGVCRFHHQANGADWGAVTTRIKQHQAVLNIMHNIKHLRKDNEKPIVGESIEQWTKRLEHDLSATILNKQKPINTIQIFKQLRQSAGLPC